MCIRDSLQTVSNYLLCRMTSSHLSFNDKSDLRFKMSVLNHILGDMSSKENLVSRKKTVVSLCIRILLFIKFNRTIVVAEIILLLSKSLKR